jgi:ATP-dependent Lon protease
MRNKRDTRDTSSWDSDEIYKPKKSKKLNNFREKIKERIITHEKVVTANFAEEETIWLIEHLDILDNLDEYTEEYYKMKTQIYEKYKNLQKEKLNKDIIEKIKNNDSDDILNKIYKSGHPDNIKSILYKKFKAHELDKSDEYFKVIEWIETILELPTNIKYLGDNKENISDMIVKLKNTLDSKLFGLDKVKERILEFYCAMLNNPFYKKKFIALVGPPGVGKTMLGKCIADAMGLTYEQISFGGIKDACALTGHSTTYIGAHPGLFANILKKSKILNPVVLLDEIDKISQTSEGFSINSVLLHVLDNSQNKRFQDMYMPEIHLDLSNIFFILALNNLDNLDPILKDRIHVVKIDGYTIEEKINIGKKFILPRVLENLLFSPNEIIINDKCMRIIINKSCENGVRELEKSIGTLCEKINILKHINSNKIKLSYNIANLKFPYQLTELDINNLL